ncbi:MAG: hypothetical protein GTN64_08145 [Candidatus Latescibacteria bacterium]|nr:hypothetical protein [Candidatus Latescibacterota bacterium]NIO78573.1 hypothetical protein [Candidatus Latescibacterota bacterium]
MSKETVKLIYKGPASVQRVFDPKVTSVIGVGELVFKRGEATEAPRFFAEEKTKHNPDWWEIEDSNIPQPAKKAKPGGGEK